MRLTTFAAAVLCLLLLPAAAEASPVRLSHRAAREAISFDTAARSLQATVGAGAATVTYDEAGHQIARYPTAAADYKMGHCVRVSARQVRCGWRLWVTLVDTGEVVWRESGVSVARLLVRRWHHVDVIPWVPDRESLGDARRRSLGDM